MAVEVVQLHLVQLDKGFRFQFLARLTEGAFRHHPCGHRGLPVQVAKLVQFILQGAFDQVEQKEDHDHERQTPLTGEVFGSLPLPFQKITGVHALAQGRQQSRAQIGRAFGHLSLRKGDSGSILYHFRPKRNLNLMTLPRHESPPR
jgi:hypothetical protein